MSEVVQEPPKNLSELTGREIDIQTFGERLRLLLATRRMSVVDYGRYQLAVNADMTEKIAQQEERTPTAPFLPEITSRLELAIFLPGPTPPSEQELIELLAYFQAELGEARAYYGH